MGKGGANPYPGWWATYDHAYSKGVPSVKPKYYDTEKKIYNNSKEDKDIHPIFKIKKSSSEDDFKKAYHKLILKHHPDKGGSSSIFIKIQEAYENLSTTLMFNKIT